MVNEAQEPKKLSQFFFHNKILISPINTRYLLNLCMSVHVQGGSGKKYLHFCYKNNNKTLNNITFSRGSLLKHACITFQAIWSIKVLKRDKRKSFTRTSDESWVAVKNFYVMCFRGYDDRVLLHTLYILYSITSILL